MRLPVKPLVSGVLGSLTLLEAPCERKLVVADSTEFDGRRFRNSLFSH